VLHQASSTSRHSSSRAPRSVIATPAATYSSGDQPTPKPGSSRPSLIRSIVVSDRASTAGGYHGAFSTLTPISARSVTAAASDISANGSSTCRKAAGIVSPPP
jgi:hypothetical protein